MINDKGILIKNIYYMLAYAFRVLQQKNYENIAAEEFHDVKELFAEILARGISQQLKQGLHREYITIEEDLPVMRGKLEINGTIKNLVNRKKVLSCEYDELSVDNIYNQILKTTANILVRDSSVRVESKNALKGVLLFFDEVSVIDPHSIRWDMLKYERNSKNYEMLMNICYFVLASKLQTTEKGDYKMLAFSDEHMEKLYEKFVLEYYKRHHKYLTEVKPAEVKWDLAEDTDEKLIQFLPSMKTDIFLRLKEKILIIDTKYYGKTMQENFDKKSYHSANMYQIFTYVKNQDTTASKNVAGVLLYAKTQEAVTPNADYVIGGNRISVKTLDLNKDFSLIAKELDELAEGYFM